MQEPVENVRKSIKDIESHSSYKTNELVIELITQVAMAEAIALDNRTTVEYAISYSNRLLGLLKMVHVVLDEGETSKLYDLTNLINATVDYFTEQLATGNIPQVEEVIELNTANQELYYLITAALQNHQYLFRVGEKEPKTLDAMLTLFKSRKEWSKNKIGKVSSYQTV